VAKVFAKLISEGLVTFQPSSESVLPTVFVIDDSPLLLKQFESLVASWGYAVRSFSDPVTALQTLGHSHPSVIFLDINMPDITGFDLVKQIRRQPDLVSVPLIILTAEKTLSNNWRARWSGCRFLSKPLIPDDIQPFQMELRMLLEELTPRDQHPSDRHSGEQPLTNQCVPRNS
jgi:CheY-like chemotaxis protein